MVISVSAEMLRESLIKVTANFINEESALASCQPSLSPSSVWACDDGTVRVSMIKHKEDSGSTRQEFFSRKPKVSKTNSKKCFLSFFPLVSLLWNY
jgi:hypothetical protein